MLQPKDPFSAAVSVSHSLRERETSTVSPLLRWHVLDIAGSWTHNDKGIPVGESQTVKRSKTVQNMSLKSAKVVQNL